MPTSDSFAPGVATVPIMEPACGRVHHGIEGAVARTPDACALMHGDERVTYREMDTRANRLARHLRALGVGPEVMVAVCLPRSTGAILSVLAVLKAGGAYLPLDPAYPAERLAFMLENARCSLLITEPEVWQGRASPGRVLSWREFEASEDIAADGARVVEAEATPGADDPLAYVIYTSGSTGQPKGVAMPHGPLVNLLCWQERVCPLAPGARVLQFAPLSFDVSFQEIFSTLGAGGTLVLIDEALRRDPRGLRRFLAEQGIARVFLPPVMLYQLAEQPVEGEGTTDSLREVMAAGEALRVTPAVARFFKRLGEGSRLHNHYGPTETHAVTAYTLAGNPDGWPELPPIGTAIDGVRVELRDDHGRLAAEGETGGLFIGGDCLARGYLHDPGLTRAKFVEGDGGRFYRTGDLARRLPDGNLQFLGRADDQVKIRGFRIEPGEIEAILSRHPGIAENAVGAVLNGAGTSQELVGYYVPRDGTVIPATELRRWMLERVPDYMVPTAFAVLERMPLTPSGKVDRRGLTQHPAGRAEETNAGRGAAATPLEKTIAVVWEETLGIRNVGVRENFFEVGGHSIHAATVHARLCQALGREFPITAIFQHPTVAALAAHLGADAATVGRKGVAGIQERARRQQQQAAATAAAARVRAAGTGRAVR